MGFKIAHQLQEVNTAWFPVDITTATNLYVGQLVQKSTGGMNGVGPLAAASGAYDVTGDQQILGVVIGTNAYEPLYDATYGQYISGVASQAGQAAVRKLGGAGMHPMGDPAPMVQVAIIGPETWLQAPIYNATYGVAPTVITSSTASTSGAGFTTGASDVQSVANLGTFYCRTGANAGIYRVVKTAHDTVHTFDMYWPYDVAIGDTFISVPYVQGSSYAQINSTAGYLGMCFNCAATAATNYFGITVSQLDLKEAGKEKVTFKFSAAHFAGIKS
jgi:hypothetical protein